MQPPSSETVPLPDSSFFNTIRGGLDEDDIRLLLGKSKKRSASEAENVPKFCDDRSRYEAAAPAEPRNAHPSLCFRPSSGHLLCDPPHSRRCRHFVDGRYYRQRLRKTGHNGRNYPPAMRKYHLSLLPIELDQLRRFLRSGREHHQ
ncbi:hypothetical protein L596_015368 [Steinernema carpocapsae]|uniref:Uncharacterized protein n=1 Tax=Steinernema carpocapsae TaxID=34508 RepID=A0A4U5NEZ4_STECR|nr:hypothetical protein L596_015368 [Steinernema carpocapsae]